MVLSTASACDPHVSNLNPTRTEHWDQAGEDRNIAHRILTWEPGDGCNMLVQKGVKKALVKKCS